MTHKAFVTGWPISHSKSPALHGFWLDRYGIDGTYEAIAVEAENFAEFLSGLKAHGFAGGNITIPHKETAHAMIQNLDPAATDIGAVNTIWFEAHVICGGNTDAYGFAANLDDFAPQWREGKRALVLGAGGAARAIVYAIREAGYEEIRIANRTYERAEKLAADFGDKCQPIKMSDVAGLQSDLDFVVNTTSVGMNGDEGKLPVDVQALPATTIVTDIVYTPLETPLLAAANNKGLRTVDGLGMLLHQAVPGFEKWFGFRPEVDRQLREHVLGLS